MTFQFTQTIAFDTNIFLFGLREPSQPLCRDILYQFLPLMRLFIPHQVHSELRNNLSDEERGRAMLLIQTAQDVTWEYHEPPTDRVAHWQKRGAKKGDAIICAALEAADVKFLISENRHFLKEISDLPFEVLSSQQLLDRIKQ